MINNKINFTLSFPVKNYELAKDHVTEKMRELGFEISRPYRKDRKIYLKIKLNKKFAGFSQNIIRKNFLNDEIVSPPMFDLSTKKKNKSKPRTLRN